MDVVVLDHIVACGVAEEEVPQEGRKGLRGHASLATCYLIRPDGVGLPPEPAERLGQLQPVLAYPEPGVQRH